MGATLEQLKKLKDLEAAQAKQQELKSKNNSEAVDLLRKMLFDVTTASKSKPTTSNMI